MRTYHHCAMPLMAHDGVPSMCRASLAIYTTREEINHYPRRNKSAGCRTTAYSSFAGRLISLYRACVSPCLFVLALSPGGMGWACM
ncbi:MAG: aminotransferase class V-fold PLP-dependent enzyme [Symbiopectobacterium sp.]